MSPVAACRRVSRRRATLVRPDVAHAGVTGARVPSVVPDVRLDIGAPLQFGLVTSRRVAAVAAVSALLLWLLKALAIWSAGGLDESALESPLFVAGLLALVVAAAAFGAALTEGRPLAVRVGAAAAGVVLGAALSILVQEGIVKPLLPASTGWVEEEAGLWVSAALVVVVVLWWNARRGNDARAGT